MSREVQTKLRHLRKKRLFRYCMHVLVWCGGMVAVAAALAYTLRVHMGHWYWAVAGLGLLSFVATYPPKRYLSYESLVEDLHKTYPALEYSLHFLLLPNSTPYYRLLRERIEPRLNSIETVPFPRRRHAGIIWASVCLLSLPVVWGIHTPPVIKENILQKEGPAPSMHKQEFTANTEWTVFPPAYTGRTPARETRESFRVIEGSDLHLKLTLSDSVNTAYLLFNFTDTLTLRNNTPQHYSARWQPAKNGLYQLHVRYQDSLYIVDTRQVNVQPDSMPHGRWLSPAQTDFFVPYRPQAMPVFQWSFEAYDDFGIAAMQATLTIARGTGEQVEFYEKQLPLSITMLSKRHQRASMQFAPLEAGATWGDEVFVSVWIRDNKEPVPQVTQLPVVRLVLEDTTTQLLSAEGFGVGVNRLPEYFRSQRQIIIDTEALLQRKGQLQDSLFRQQSQNIAFDQKALRMRYGKFLGEEDYLTASSVQVEKEEEHEEEHHEHEEEHHHEEHTPAGSQENPLLEYQHLHDLSEINTFLDPATRDTLKKALAAMWESEKYLRLAKPQKALPFQYEALKYLKMVQQKSRVYVRKSGVDLPPLTEEYRLSKTDEVPKAPRRRVLPWSQTAPSYEMLSRRWQSLWLSYLTGSSFSAAEWQDLWQAIARLPLPEEQRIKLFGLAGALQQQPGCADCKRQLLKYLFRIMQQPALPQRPYSRMLQVP